MFQLPEFKGAARQRGYGIGGIFKELTRTLESFVKNRLLNFGEQALQSGVQVLDDDSRVEDVRAAIKRRAVERGKNMSKKSISRAPEKKTSSCKPTVTGSRLTTTKKEREYRWIFCKWI